VTQDDKSIFDFEMPEADDSFKLKDDSELDFGQPEQNDLINLDNEIADQSEQLRVMECVCPKCAEKTEIDLALMPENGFVTTCSSCNKQIHIMRESCACRAKRKSFEINCADCGKLLDQRPHCPSCGKIFPDYFVAFNPEDVRRKSRKEFFYNKWIAVRDLNISFAPTFKGRSHDSTHGYSPAYAPVHTSAGTSKLLSRKYAVLTVLLLVTFALIGAGAFAYNYHKSGQSYAENYFKTLYCIKTGVDSNVKTFTLLKTEWESASAAGRSFSPRISYDEARSIKLRGEIDNYMQKLSKPPKRFSQANENLNKIHNVYLDSETLIQSKPISLQELSNSIDNLNKKMSTASQELKSNLPDSLKPELANAKLKYRGLKEF
jgi:hypothetical protein